MSDASAALLKAGLALLHSQASKALQTTWKDAGTFAGVVSNGANDPKFTANTKAALKKLAKDLSENAATVTALKAQITACIGEITTALPLMAQHFGSGTANGSIQAGIQFGKVIAAVRKAVDGIAKAVTQDPAQQDAIRNIADPIVAPMAADFAAGAKALVAGFDAACAALFDMGAGPPASERLRSLVKWDPKEPRLYSTIDFFSGGPPPKAQGSALVNLRTPKLTLFFTMKDPCAFGLTVESDVEVGLLGDPMMKSLIPGAAAKTDKTVTAITIDTVNGVTLGSGKDKRIVLPVRFRIGGVELRELAVSQPDPPDAPKTEQIDLTTVIAVKIGGAIALVAEGGGVTLVSNGGPFAAAPRAPDGMGFALNAGPVSGGGFLRHRKVEKDYGGVVDLSIGPVGVTAMAMLTASPKFSFVAILGVRFLPAIELGFGFTLRGVGGVVAIDRTLSVDALGAALKDGVVSNLLFPENPVASSPKILDQLATVFPAQDGAFAVGPIAELGWGSQSGLVRAKVGVVLVLPDPSVVVLGSGQVTVPPPGLSGVPNVIDLKVDLMAVFTPEEIYVRASLGQSKIAGVSVSGDFGMVARWAGGAEFALSAGGFFPRYKAPPRLADLGRITIPLSPPVPKVEITATGYVALTANSVQLGAAIDLKAKIGPVSGSGHLGVDALFEWAPTLHFVFDVQASVKVKFKGYTVAGASFSGTLEGATPWRLEGSASVSILFWDVDFDLGPWSWGDNAAATAPESALDVVAAALGRDEAWSARGTAKRYVTLRQGAPATTVLLEPSSSIAVKQERLPIDTPISRIGPAPSVEKRLGFTNPTVGGAKPAFSGHVTAEFAPGQYLDLTQDQKIAMPAFETLPAGFELAPLKGVVHGAPVETPLTWETIFPQAPANTPRGPAVAWNLSKITPVIIEATPMKSIEQIVHPYGPVGPETMFGVTEPGLTQVTELGAMGNILSQVTSHVDAQALIGSFASLGIDAALGLDAAGGKADVQLVGKGMAL